MAITDQNMRDTKGEQAFSSRPGRNPLIGGGAGERHTRFDLYCLATAACPSLTHMPVGEAVVNRRDPGTQIVGAE